MRNFSLFVLLAFSTFARAVTVAHVQSSSNQSGATPSSVSCTFGSPVGAKHLVYIGLANFSTPSPVSLTYAIAGTTANVTPDVQNLTYSSGSNFYEMSGFYVLSAIGGETTFTASAPTGLNFTAITCDEWSVDSGSFTLDKSDAGATGNSTAPAAPGVTTTAAGDLIVGLVGSTNDTISTGSGFTLGAVSAFPNANEYQQQTTASAIAATASLSSANPWGAHTIAFKNTPLVASPTSILQNTTGNVISLSCPACSWTSGTPGTPTFTIAGSGVSITSQHVLTATTATITVSAGIPTGQMVIADPSNNFTAIISVVPETACSATDSFSGTGALNPSNWTQTTVTSGTYGFATIAVSALNQASGNVAPATASTKGMAIWKGSSCTPPANQSSQVTLTGADTGVTGPVVRGSADGTGYVWDISTQSISAFRSFVTFAQVAENCVKPPPVGATYQLVARGNWLYGYVNGVLSCSGADARYPTGNPGIHVDRESGTTDAVGSFVAGSSSLLAPTMNYVTGTYAFSPVISITSVSGAKICYTTDGSTPTAPLAGTCSGGTTQTYSSALTVASTETISAITTTFGLANSVATTNTYTVRPGGPVTWYVDAKIGGPRFSSNVPLGVCDGTIDAAPVGTTPNQHCAFNDVRMLWQDSSYTDGSAFPGWGWVGAGGDTYKVMGSIANGVSYRVGWDSNSTYCGATGCWGLTGNASGSGPPPIPSGSPADHTKFLGGNAGACTAQSARTQLHGGWSVGDVLNMSGTSYTDVACIDLTDFSGCSSNGVHNCQNGVDDFAHNGLLLNNSATNDTITDIRTHGLEGGMAGPTGDNFTITDMASIGNGSSGWNTDLGDGSTGVGSLNVTNFDISWNGCSEEYPLVDPLPYNDCSDQSFNGGYGDGWGTTTVQSIPPGWQVHFDQGTVSYNTQDGLDALHVSGVGSTITHTRVLAYGNQGQQLKVGGAAAKIQNSVINGNCEAMVQGTPLFPGTSPIPGTPAGFNANLGAWCRAAGTAILIDVTPGDPTIFQDNTVFDTQAINLEVEYATFDGGSTNTLLYNNNVCVAFLNGGGADSNCIYSNSDLNMLTNPGASFTNNSYWGDKIPCPRTGDTNSLCINPGLVDETYHAIGYGNVAPASASSAVVGKGIAISGVTLDYAGNNRPNPPSIGAMEFASAPAPTLVSIALTPNPGAVNVGSTLAMTCTATFSDSSTAACTSPAWTSGTPAHATVNSSTGVVTGVAAGSSSITATIGSISGSSAVTVSASAPTLVSIALTPSTFAQTVGGLTATLTCTATMSDSSTTACASRGAVSWASSAPSVATVSGGIVTAVAFGTANITASVASVTSPPSVDTISQTIPFSFTINGAVVFSGQVILK